ncbi:1467_t:CDS:2, partial [Racocetra fulgida]
MTTAISSSEAFNNIDENPGEVRNYIEENRLADMEEEIETVERKRYRQATWAPNKKPYLMYLPLSNESE